MLGSPKQSQSLLSTTKAFPQWMRRSLPSFVVGSAARGVCDEAVAEAPGPSRVPAFVLPACLACWHAWRLRWQPAREAPVRMTVKQSRHPHLRLSQTIGTPGRARRACVLTLWTEDRTLLQVGQDDFNPPLAGGQGVAVFTSERSSGGGRGGPVTSVRKGQHHRHRRDNSDPQGACRPVEERAGAASRLRAVPPLGARCRGGHQE
ncbi:hypothetical protein ECC02_010698 [Trypanosoma cruzi]|uniref:Uncharacterized protein n=1 Tax=Trypanosoma cruzi TaxID=5693 RepID=A0A7J6XQR2_TRYCR|nr:hypothetical protein ECC02_010698 [Trypanosoma cruzi]